MSMLIEDIPRTVVKMPAGTLCEEGVEAVGQLLNKYGLPQIVTEYDWYWDLVVIKKNNKYVGTLAKRISKYLWVEHNIKAPPEFMGELGGLITHFADKHEEYELDVVSKLEWHAGDFGDRGSCFFGGTRIQRDILEDYMAKAIRFYKNGKGFARSWVMETPTDGLWIMFNAYGLELPRQARVLATLLCCDYCQVTVGGYAVTFNAGGYLLGEAAEVNKYVPGKNGKYHVLRVFDMQMQHRQFQCVVTGRNYRYSEGMIATYGEGQRVIIHKSTRCRQCDECGDKIVPGYERQHSDRTICSACSLATLLTSSDWLAKRKDQRKAVLV